MTEREMEDLLWEHPEKFLDEPLKQFQRQPSSSVGRADLIFEDRLGRLLVIELKRDTLERGAIMQLVDYYGMLKSRFPNKPVELMIVAGRVPQERRMACSQYDIEAVEISQKKYRDVAEEVGYVFKSELPTNSIPAPTLVNQHLANESTLDFGRVGHAKVEKEWYYWQRNGRACFLAFVNAKGSCSIRVFDASTGVFLRKEYKGGDFQHGFADFITTAALLRLSRQPNLERDCRERLPATVLSELRRQIPS